MAGGIQWNGETGFAAHEPKKQKASPPTMKRPGCCPKSKAKPKAKASNSQAEGRAAPKTKAAAKASAKKNSAKDHALFFAVFFGVFFLLFVPVFPVVGCWQEPNEAESTAAVGDTWHDERTQTSYQLVRYATRNSCGIKKKDADGNTRQIFSVSWLVCKQQTIQNLPLI